MCRAKVALKAPTCFGWRDMLPFGGPLGSNCFSSRLPTFVNLDDKGFDSGDMDC